MTTEYGEESSDMPHDSNEVFVHALKSSLADKGFKYCRAVQFVADQVYARGGTVGEVVQIIEAFASAQTNFHHKVQ